MIASRQITNTEIFAIIVALVLKWSSHRVLFINCKDNKNLLKSILYFKKIAYFKGELFQNYK